jgi:hypothetical protein
MTARKTPTKAPPAKRAPTSAPAPAAPEPTTVDLSARFAAALDRGFSIRAVNAELFDGTSFAWRARRGSVNAERDAELIKTLAAWLDKVDSGKIAPPERAVAGPRATGPTKAALLALIHDVRAAKSIAAVRELIDAVVPPAS